MDIRFIGGVQGVLYYTASKKALGQLWPLALPPLHEDVIKWTLSALLAIRAGNSPVPSEIPAQKPVTRSFDVFFNLRLNKRLSEQSWGWWFETPSRPFWRHRNDFDIFSEVLLVGPRVLTKKVNIVLKGMSRIVNLVIGSEFENIW